MSAYRLGERVAAPFVWLFVGVLAGWEMLTRLVRRRRPPRLRLVVDDEEDEEGRDE